MSQSRALAAVAAAELSAKAEVPSVTVAEPVVVESMVEGVALLVA